MAHATGQAKRPPPAVVRGPRTKLARAGAGALVIAVVVLAGQAARAQDDEVDVQVFNGGLGAIEVRIYDLVCRQLVFDGEILDDASVSVPCCPDQNGLAAITVVDRFGRRQTFQGLDGSSSVEVEFN